MAGGVWADVGEAVRAAVRTTDVVEPVPEWVEQYREGVVSFRALYPG